MTNERVSDERLAEIVATANYAGDDADLWLSSAEGRALAAELQSLRSAREAEPDFWAVWSATGSHIGTWVDEADARAALTEYESRIPRMTGLIKPLYLHPSQGLGVRVKGLEWGERKSNGDIYADSVVGEYGVGEVHGKHTVMLRVGDQDSRVAQASGFEDAKAAAQADYERRILSALSTSAEKVEGAADYLVWSNEHRAWWRANSQGYARSILEAGRYTRKEAVDIADRSRNGWKLDQRPDEIAVAIADLPAPIRAALTAALSPIPDNQVEG